MADRLSSWEQWYLNGGKDAAVIFETCAETVSKGYGVQHTMQCEATQAFQ